ncbi:terpenoid synthase [Dendrothele bispora CBS 962.96]|uniref:(2E,6E)-farnesyl diphosphate synthase n=1 Tax=Dendrothele bispora (strain CBS 962.96) TaxID=1314807 RepID=A0A4S8KV32_DENBC|nr:terpenoid synthase [Dendrothele bispora CBS 962.96]
MQLLDTIVERLSEDPDWSEKNEPHPRKDVRSQFIDAFNLWLNVPKEKTKSIAKIVNMLHTASLLIDDIQDNSQLWRGHPVAHKIYGVPQTINTANYVYFLAFHLESIINERSFTAEILNLHRGQGLDLFWRDNLSCPTEKEYVDMTGGLLRIGVKLMMAMAKTGVDVNYVPLVNLIGVFFQIRDDLMNLSSVTYTSNKGFAEDLTEGKFSFPVVHGIRADGENREILNVLQKKPETPTLKLHTVNYLKEHTESFQYTLVVLATMETSRRKGKKPKGNREPGGKSSYGKSNPIEDW